MAKSEMALNMNDFTSKITIKKKLKGLIKFKIRSFIGCQIMKLAAFVMGCGIEIDMKQNEK